MVISRFEFDNCTYFCLHAEQAFEKILVDIGQGIFEKSIRVTVVDRLIENIEKNPINTEYILFDFCNIEIIQPNQGIRLNSVIINTLGSKKITLCNVNKTILNQLMMIDLINIVLDEYEETDNSIQIKLYTENENKIPKIIPTTEEIFNSYFIKLLEEKYISKKDRFHFSSKVFVNRFIDIKKFISLDNNFFIYTLYRLALEMSKKKDNRSWYITEETDDIILFSQNMNSSYIASILSSFLNIDVLLIDHLGPKNKMYMLFDNKIQKEKKYLVISDMICMGTEVRLAKNIIEFSGAEYIGNASIVRINTVGNESQYKYNNIEAIYQIGKNNSIGYTIKTALDI